ncbi:MAG: TetR/AcrR family transcriptional regulator [Pseudomonadota bacterium]
MKTKDRLVQAAARLFRQRGYDGVSVDEILKEAEAPKGSLYHHFPKGKADLALAASDWSSERMVAVIEAAFDDAHSPEDGLTTLCHKLARLFELSRGREGCPISATLFSQRDDDLFRDHSRALYENWIARLARHLEKLGEETASAASRAQRTFLLIQGGWVLARARGDAEVLRALPEML